MANVIVTLPEQETEKYELFLKPFLDDPAITAVPYNIELLEFKNSEMYFNTHPDKIGSQKTTCGWTYNGSSVFTKKTVVPITVQAAFEQCYTYFENTIFASKMKSGWEIGELTPEIVNYLIDERAYAFNRDLLTWFFLGDTASASAYYDTMDGMFKKLLAGVAAVDGTVDMGAVTASDLAPNSFYDTMKAIKNGQTRQLKGTSNDKKVWQWTYAVYEKYIDYLESSTQGTAGIVQRDHIENGITSNRFLGIPIFAPQIVDERLLEDFTTGSPAVTENEFAIILTDPTNHHFFMDGGLTKTKTWYSDDDDVYRIAGSTKIFYEYGFGDQNVIAGIS